jgi:hypothetical protein
MIRTKILEDSVIDNLEKRINEFYDENPGIEKLSTNIAVSSNRFIFQITYIKKSLQS